MPNKNIAKLNKTYPFKITQMTEESIPKVKEIEIKSGLSPWASEEYKKEILRQDSVCLTAERNSEIIGFLIVRLIMHNVGVVLQNESANEFPNEAEIYNFAVSDTDRSKGIGKALLRKFLVKAKELKISNVWLEVRESNYRAIDFYEKQGFYRTQVRKNFYKFPTEDGVLMQLQL